MSLRKPKPAVAAPYRGPGSTASPTDLNPYAVLSMHQPWASLLVFGIKRIEGRSWPTQHRGRLWIHATSQQPSHSDIQELESFYTEVHATQSKLPIFPQSYPASALLGCIDVVDCLPAEDMAAWPGLPAGLQMEVGSPFAWLCQAPQRLVVPQRMPGAPRIWTLPKAKLDPLARGLKDPPGVIPFSWADMPPQIGPASSAASGSAGSRANSQSRPPQRQQPGKVARADGSKEEQTLAPAVVTTASASQPAANSSDSTVGQQGTGEDAHDHPALGDSEPPAKRTHTWAELAAQR